MDKLSLDRFISVVGKAAIFISLLLTVAACGGASPVGIYDLGCHLIIDLEGEGDGDDCQSLRDPLTGDEAIELIYVVAPMDSDEGSLFASYTDGPEATFILYSDKSVSWHETEFTEEGLVYENTTWESYVVDREIDGTSIGEAEVYLINIPDSLEYDDGIILSKYNGRVVLGTLILSENL
mgnify:CR=1 FL=1